VRATLEQGLAGWVIRHLQPALLVDTSHDDRWLRRPDDEVGRTGPKSAICIPLLSRDKLVGVLTIVHPVPGFFNTDHLALLQAISDLAGIAVDNARLYESLQAANWRYRELFEDSIDPILITDWQGKILEANRGAVQVSGYPIEKLQQLTVMDLHEVNHERTGEKFEKLQDGQAVRYEADLMRYELDKLPVEVYTREVVIEGQKLIQWILRDISERKALASLQDDLMAMVYHDLRSPLGNITSSLDVLLTMLPKDVAVSLKPVIDITTRSTARMQRLISSLLDIYRLESGQPITQRKEVSAHDLAQEAVDTIQATLEGRQQTVQMEVPEDLPLLWVDADMVKRVMINLLENASKFTPVQGRMAICGVQEGEWIRMWVQDSGPGINTDMSEKIFEKFTRMQAHRSVKGIGLGLAFCRLAVQAHGGRIWVESQEGKGSRFLFTLPWAKPA
jgi:PAS domain S-box-containing protein